MAARRSPETRSAIAKPAALESAPDSESRRRFVVVAALGQRRLGLVVDFLYGQEDIVIKPLGKSLSAVRGFAGATELGDQRVGLVLDAAGLIEEVLAGVEAPRTLERAIG